MNNNNDNIKDTTPKIITEIIPEEGEDVNKLRKRIHSLITSARKGCKRVRTWVIKKK